MKVIKFNNDSISNYEKTILKSIATYLINQPNTLDKDNLENILINQPNTLDKDNLENIALFFSIDYENIVKLCETINNENNLSEVQLIFNGEVIAIKFDDNEIFDCMLKYYSIVRNIKNINLSSENEDLIANCELYESIIHNIIMINIFSNESENIYNNNFSIQYVPQTFKTFNPRIYLEYLNIFKFFDDYYTNKKEILPLIYLVINYQLMTHTNAMFFIIILQILKNSEFYDDVEHSIAEELYNNYMCLLKDAKVILIQCNYLFMDICEPFEQRQKDFANTTRLHIMYGFDNYDSYSSRLDFMHKGVSAIHYNNKSPGGIKSNWFTDEDYGVIIQENPWMYNCFLQQSGKWFLKEISSCNLNRDEKSIFYEVTKRKEHVSVFKNKYQEKDILSFMESLNKFLMSISTGCVDKNGLKAKYCFNLDYLMCRLEMYLFCLRIGDNINANKLRKNIVDKAVNYGLIKSNEKSEYDSIYGIQIIIELAWDRVYNLEG